MKARLDIQLDPELKQAAQAMAKARYTTLSELARQALVNEVSAWKRSQQLKETH